MTRSPPHSPPWCRRHQSGGRSAGGSPHAAPLRQWAASRVGKQTCLREPCATGSGIRESSAVCRGSATVPSAAERGPAGPGQVKPSEKDQPLLARIGPCHWGKAHCVIEINVFVGCFAAAHCGQLNADFLNNVLPRCQCIEPASHPLSQLSMMLATSAAASAASLLLRSRMCVYQTGGRRPVFLCCAPGTGLQEDW